MDRWQIKTLDVRTGNYICTTEMPQALRHIISYRYESCMFSATGDSDVLDRYDTQSAAEAGHAHLVDKHLIQLQLSAS